MSSVYELPGTHASAADHFVLILQHTPVHPVFYVHCCMYSRRMKLTEAGQVVAVGYAASGCDSMEESPGSAEHGGG